MRNGTTNQCDVDIEQNMKANVDEKASHVQIASFFFPFQTKILLAKTVSQTLFFVVLQDRFDSLELWRVRFFKIQSKSKISYTNYLRS